MPKNAEKLFKKGLEIDEEILRVSCKNIEKMLWKGQEIAVDKLRNCWGNARRCKENTDVE